MNGYNNQYSRPGTQYPPRERERYGWKGGQFAPRNGGGFGQPSAMGFHSENGHMGGQRGFRQEDEEEDAVLDFFRAIVYGERPCPEELKEIVLGIVGEQADSMLGQYGYSQTGHGAHDEHHRRYKEVLEELRDVPNVTEAVKKAGQMFEGLTDEDRKVLQQILNRPSYKKMASMVNMTPDRFMEVKHGLEQKLKR